MGVVAPRVNALRPDTLLVALALAIALAAAKPAHAQTAASVALPLEQVSDVKAQPLSVLAKFPQAGPAMAQYVAQVLRRQPSVVGFRFVDLERAPFNLPKPLAYLPDYRRGFEFPRYVGLWSRTMIRDALAKAGNR
jgi:hypothetical protein